MCVRFTERDHPLLLSFKISVSFLLQHVVLGTTRSVCQHKMPGLSDKWCVSWRDSKHNEINRKDTQARGHEEAEAAL